MKTKILLGILLLVSKLSIAQVVTLSDLKGVWKFALYENSFYIFYGDSVASVGLRNSGELGINFGKVGFIDENDPYFIKLASTQNVDSNDKDISLPIHIRVKIKEEDIKHIKLKNVSGKKNIFYDDGILSSLGIEALPVRTGTRMEIINSNVHVYIKEQDLPPLFIHKLSLKYPPQVLKRMLDKTFTKIRVSKSFIYSKPTVVSKMYLIRNDIIEIIEEKEIKGTKWVNFQYYGSSATTGKVIKGWIKKSDVE